MVSDGSADRALRQFMDDDFAAWVAEYPEFGTQVGAAGVNDRWTDDSPDGIDRRVRHLRASLDQVRAIDRGALSESGRLSYDLYRETLEASVAGLAFGDDPFPLRDVVPHNLWMPINQMEGVQIVGPQVLDLQPRRRRADLEDYLARLAAYPAAIAQQVALMRIGLEKQQTPPRAALDGLPGQISGLIPPEPMASPLLRPLAELPSSIGEDDRTAVLKRARTLYADALVPAVSVLRDYVVREYLPACRETIAASALPNGAASYAHHVRWQTTLDLAPRAIHEIGVAEVARIRAQMEQLVRSTGFTGSLRQFNDFLRTDPRFHFARADELVDRYRVIAKTIDPNLARIFGRLPRLPYGVQPVPEFRAPSSPAGYYIPGSPAAGRPGTFYANSYDLSARFRWEMDALALHEGVPGHHLQIALAQELDDVPEYRRWAGYSAFIEGWGLYAESLGEEVGLLGDPYSKYGQLTFDMWRAARLVVDTGMHALGWTRQQAIDFCLENTSKSELDIRVEVDRYIVWPGQALAYKLGQLKIRELRSMAEQRLGDRFDERAFHDAVLGQAALPLAVLEGRVRAWIETRGPAA